jgi:hypothetical protein
MVVPGQRDETPPLLSTPIYQPASTLSDTTRRLCCAPYVDVAFGNAVIREVVESERKAVPPSYGFDLDPVVRHCLRARRLLIIRYAIVTGLLIAGLCLNFLVTLPWLALCAAVVGFRSSAVRELPRSVRLGIISVVVIVVLCFLGYTFFGFLASQLLGSTSLGSDSRYSGGDIVSGPSLSGIFASGVARFLFLAPVFLALGMLLTLFLSRRQTYGIITTELAPGAPASAPRSSNPRVEWRLGVVAAMQRGNISVHDIDPYAGAGWREFDWSFAVALNPRPGVDNGSRRRGASRIPLDGAALNQRVHDAVVALRDTRLRDGERIPNVYVVPYVAADGYRRADDPLIDPRTRTPRTLASPETLAAIEGCPQGGLRHYLRAVVPANGKEIRTPDGRLVLPAQDSGIGVTAFIHLAVEGGMLYTEFVATVMPQIHPMYHVGDNLRPERVPALALVDTLRNFLRDNLMGPVYLVRMGWDAIRLQGRMARSARRADEFRYYDYGAHFSVRELAAQRPTVKFMQMLDGAKYIKLLDKAVTEAIVDFLDENGVDTTEFQTAVLNVAYDFRGATFRGGQQSFGGSNVNIQNNVTGGARPAPAARPSGGSRG